MSSGIYKIESQDGRVYVGSSENIERRWQEHINTMRRNKHHSIHLQRAFNKYGADYFTFSVLEYCAKDRLLHYEQIWLNILFTSLDKHSIFNSNPTAGNGAGRKVSEETRLKMSLARKGRKGTPHTKESKKKMSESHKGKKWTKERRKEFSLARTGVKFSELVRSHLKRNTYTFVSPYGDVVETSDLPKLCKDNGLDFSCMVKVFLNKRTHHKGWTNAKNRRILYRFINPQNELVEAYYIMDLCRRFGLDPSGMTKVHKYGKVYKGWRKAQ